MKKIVSVVLVVVLAGMLAGCAKKEEQKVVTNEQARRLLVAGTVLLKQGEVIKAVQSFATAIKTAPGYFESYYMLAETFIHLKQFEQAKGVLNIAADRFPDNPVTYYLLSVVYDGEGSLMPAIVSARKSVDLFRLKKDEAGERRAIVLLGVLVQKAKQQSEAEMVNAAAETAK